MLQDTIRHAQTQVEEPYDSATEGQGESESLEENWKQMASWSVGRRDNIERLKLHPKLEPAFVSQC